MVLHVFCEISIKLCGWTGGGVIEDFVSLLLMFIFFLIIVIMGFVSSVRNSYVLGTISFISDSFVSDDLRFDSGNIKSIAMTAPGVYDPSRSKCSSLHIINSSGE